MSKEKLYEYKIMKSQGAKHFLIKTLGENTWKFHRWGGPAIDPVTKESPLKKEYYLHGIKYSKFEYDQVLKDMEGLPYYKQAGANVRM